MSVMEQELHQFLYSAKIQPSTPPVIRANELMYAELSRIGRPLFQVHAVLMSLVLVVQL